MGSQPGNLWKIGKFQVVPVAFFGRNPDVEFLGEINVIPTLRTSWEDSLEKSLEWIEKRGFSVGRLDCA